MDGFVEIKKYDKKDKKVRIERTLEFVVAFPTCYLLCRSSRYL